MANLLSHISVRELKRALTIRSRIEGLERKLTALLGDSPTQSSKGKIPRKAKVKGRRKMSAAGRAKIAAAARARWAKAKKAGRNSL